MIKLIILDVDGCMTDGSIVYSNGGDELKSFNVQDGLGIVSWIKLGGQIAIITGRESKIVARRAKELGIKHLYQNIGDKYAVMQNIMQQLDIDIEETAAIGDDLNDYNMLLNAHRSFTPANGTAPIKEIVDTVLVSKGGSGAIREMIDILIDKNHQYKAFVDLWR